jgi:hypothetical protein
MIAMPLGMAGLATLALGIAGPASAAPSSYRVHMYGNQEVPEKGPESHADGVFKLDPEAGQICYAYAYDGPGEPTAMHLHKGEKGSAGPVIVDFKIAENGPKACVPVDKATIDSIAANPAGHYSNIHTAEYPKGAARGQLNPAGPGSMLPGPLGDLLS